MTGGPKNYAKIDHKIQIPSIKMNSQGPKGTQLMSSHSTAVTKPESPKTHINNNGEFLIF